MLCAVGIVVPVEWENVAHNIIADQRRPQIMLIVGAVDTGKTTFCRWLANELLKAGRYVAIIDADLGQSNIGLPGTIGLGIVTSPVDSLHEVACLASYFIGSTSPVGYLVPMVIGLRFMVERAIADGVETILIDTDGLIAGDIGFALKEHFFELVSPTHSILLERNQELAALWQIWSQVYLHRCWRVPASSGAIFKPREQRRQWRERCYQAWLRRCSRHRLSFDQVVFLNSRLFRGIKCNSSIVQKLQEELQLHIVYASYDGASRSLSVVTSCPVASIQCSEYQAKHDKIYFYSPEQFNGLLLGMLDQSLQFLGPALCLNINFAMQLIDLLVEADLPKRTRFIQFGRIRLNTDGTEKELLPRNAI